MELSKEDNILLQGFIEGRLDELERNALLTRLENEPNLQREFERLTDKELSTFIKQHEREKLRNKLAKIRENADVDFEEVLTQGSSGKRTKAGKTNLYDKSDLAGNMKYVKPKSLDYNKFISTAAVISIIALISGLGFWYFEKEDNVIQVADKNQTIDSIKVDIEGNTNDTMLIESTNTNKISKGGIKNLEEKESQILLRNIRVINKNRLGFGPKAIKKDSLMIAMIKQNAEAWYSCKEGKIIFGLPANQMNQFKNLNPQQFVYISGSEILATGLYFNIRKNYYFMNCDELPQILEKSIVKDQIELEELEELFYSK
jgi:hypothetical protein